VTNSTLAGNSATVDGGAIRSDYGTLVLANSTLSGNHASGNGGGRSFVGGAPTGTNCTLSGNWASAGGGIHNYEGTLNFANTIVANSTSGGDCSGSASGLIGTNRNNLVRDGSCSLGGVNFRSGNPQLGALAFNGGPTQTMALLGGSPAIDAGDDATGAASPVSGRDQRGVARQGAHCDIGAYEYVDYSASADTIKRSAITRGDATAWAANCVQEHFRFIRGLRYVRAACSLPVLRRAYYSRGKVESKVQVASLIRE